MREQRAIGATQLQGWIGQGIWNANGVNHMCLTIDNLDTFCPAIEAKGIKLTRAHAVETKLWDRLDHEVGAKGTDGLWDGGEAKDVDAITRALLASEKIQAAAAGARVPGSAGRRVARAVPG